MLTRKSCRVLAPLVLALVAGCTAGPQLAHYPRRVIDRPYTLPTGVAFWGGASATRVTTRPHQPIEFDQSVPVPLSWGQALTDELTLLYPVPVILYQLANTPDHRVGVSGGLLGFGVSSGRLITTPGVSGEYRSRLGDGLALDVFAEFVVTHATDVDAVPGRATTGVRVWRQLTDTLAVRAEIRGQLRHEDLKDPWGTDSRAAFPLDAGLLWSLARQWDLTVGYTLATLWIPAPEDGRTHHWLNLAFRHFF